MKLVPLGSEYHIGSMLIDGSFKFLRETRKESREFDTVQKAER